jgi:glycerol-3-phosphate acyltransferase PlsY
METLTILAVGVGAYLIGSISGARLITRLFAPGKHVPDETELRLEGSDKTMVMKSVSATSVSANVGARYGFMTYVFDVLKVFIPVFLLKTRMPGSHYYLVAATTGIAGHIWPLYHGFKGGRGISAIYGGVFAIDWPGVLISAFAGMIFGFAVLRDLYLTYMAGLWFLIPWLWWRTRDPYVVLYAVAANILFFVSSVPELRAWYKIKKEPVWNEPTEAWKFSAMGRGIIKMGTKLGLIKKKAPRDARGTASQSDVPEPASRNDEDPIT